ncbi:TrsE-like protein (fragment) [Petrocella atlantisensis]|uniref:TrsE-like protein n=1 Tax=Petrocella atlantisensis TaxID=2173034 RepID=A0A3P7P2B1_9FIRM
MAYVSVPKDLSKVKTKVALNLTLRQIISFSIGAVVGFPVYWYSRTTVGNDIAVYLMIGCVLPFFMAAIFEKDGIVFEKYLGYIIKQRFLNPKIRPYKTENFYEFLDNLGREEVKYVQKERKGTGKTSAKKAKTKRQQQKVVKEADFAAEAV